MVRTPNAATAKPTCNTPVSSNSRELRSSDLHEATLVEHAEAEDTAVAFASLTPDKVVLGEGPRATYLKMLMDGYASGADPFYTLLALKDRMGKDAAAETARSEVMAAYHRMQMAIIGNLKA
jgi:hypothetical protein